MKLIIKSRLCFVCALILLCLVFQYGNIFAEGVMEEAVPYDPAVSITLNVGLTSDLANAYEKVVNSKDFKAKFPNMKVEFHLASHPDHHSRLTTVIAAGQGAWDVEWIEINYIARFAGEGGFTDLSKPPFTGKEVVKDIVKFAVSHVTTDDGRIVAIPVDIAPIVMFYRKSLADKAGVKLDNLKNWDEYIAACKKLTIDTNGDGKIDQYGLPHPFELSYIPLGGGIVGWYDENGNPLEPKERYMPALRLVKKIREAGIDGDFGEWSPGWLNAFKKGKIATMFCGAWFGGMLKDWLAPDFAGDWRIAYPPGRALATKGGSYLGIPLHVPGSRKGAAWEFIKYIATNKNAQINIFKTQDAFPALTTVYKDPVMNEPVAYYGNQRARKIIADIALRIPASRINKNDNMAKDFWHDAVTMILLNKMSVEKAYQRAKKRISELMDY